MGILLCGLNPDLKVIESSPIGWAFTRTSYGPWMISALFLREAVQTFRAGFSSAIRRMGQKGFHDVDYGAIFSKYDIMSAEVELNKVYLWSLNTLIIQYFAFSFVAYLIIMYKGKSHSGSLGMAVVKYWAQSEIIDPIWNYIKYGTASNLTQRERQFLIEKADREEFLKKEKRIKRKEKLR